jgi:hypothetical protein
MMSVQKKFLMSRGMAINAQQAADFIHANNDFCKH